MNVVIDTNVFVSSFFGGNPRKVIELWFQGQIVLCLSAPILDEYLGILNRMGLDNSSEAKELIKFFRKNIHTRFAANPAQVCALADPDDDKFLSAAVELDAEYIISGDKHLLVQKNYMGIEIMPPRQFMDKFAKKS